MRWPGGNRWALGRLHREHEWPPEMFHSPRNLLDESLIAVELGNAKVPKTGTVDHVQVIVDRVSQGTESVLDTLRSKFASIPAAAISGWNAVNTRRPPEVRLLKNSRLPT
jgi:hypothetical protein